MNQLARLSISLAILLGTLLVMRLPSTGESVPIRQPLASLPMKVGMWQGGGGTAIAGDVLEQLMLTDYVVRPYMDGAGRVLSLYIGYWDTQRKGAAIHSPKNCLPGAGWLPVESTLAEIPLGPPHGSITVNRYLVQKGRDQQVVLFWYQSQGQTIAGEIAARIAMVRGAVIRNRTDAAIVRVSSLTYGDTRETYERLVSYVRALYPLLGDHLPD